MKTFVYDDHDYTDDNGVILDSRGDIVGSVNKSFCGEYWQYGKGSEIYGQLHENIDNAYTLAVQCLIVCDYCH